MSSRRDYLSYLLRLWRTGNQEKGVWRASLENPLTGERQGFANLKQLAAFLETRINTQTAPSDDVDESGMSNPKKA